MSQSSYNQKMTFLLSLFLFSSLLFTTEAQKRVSNITLGSSLSPSNNLSWLSESGQFAFGFYPYGSGFSIGIWLEDIQQKTVVWTANRDKPPFLDDAVLILSTDGRLVVDQKDGQRTFIAAADGMNTSSASMLDSGNFVLFDASLKIIWQTFDSPTDTILPGQSLLPGHNLVSDVSATNHSQGKFQLVMQIDGNLVQYPVESRRQQAAYWDTNTSNAGNNVTLNLDSNGQLYLLNATGMVIKNLTKKAAVSGNKLIYRATIDADGIFRLYSHSSNQSDSWSITWSSRSNRCIPKGVCGVNSYCTLMDTAPVCQCPQGFDFIDQAITDLGCQRNYTRDACIRKIKQSFDVLELSSVNWEDDAYATLESLSKDDCIEECLKDCNCEVATYRSLRQVCKKLKLPLRYGRKGMAGRVTTLVKISPEARTPIKVGKKKAEPRMDIFITGVASLVLAFLLLASTGILIYRNRIQLSRRIFDQRDERFIDVTLKSFTYEELKNATNNFTDNIGKGAFGTVFRGVISNGKRVVAIKRLEKVVAEGEREFLNEMKAIGRTHHKNLVQLLGYCYDGTNRLLVYEYMKNGSLADFLFRSNLKINWEGRIAIILNIARGVLYLHEECEIQIIHCDIKPENILIDDKGYAKIADFGLAKLLMPNQSKTYTGIRGTRGYVAPEWHRNMPITVKADVYSFGVMLFEIICCRRSVEADVPDNEAVLVNWVYDCFKANELEKLVQEDEVEKEKLERMVKVGLWCTQDEPSSRPSMKKVTLMLEGTDNISDPLCPSSIYSYP